MVLEKRKSSSKCHAEDMLCDVMICIFWHSMLLDLFTFELL
uniref:Uncharacterized protein n=1 Tax=Rhizophora mucronata TaxID=61149 RepID=A0A2P2NWQ8_RHIMU